jgi:hypothetical protein
MSLIFVFLAIALGCLFDIIKITIIIFEWVFGGETSE